MDRIMNKETFRIRIKEDIRKYLPEQLKDAEVSTGHLGKPGSLGYDAIYVKKDLGEKAIARSLSFDEVYETYKQYPGHYEDIVQDCANTLSADPPFPVKEFSLPDSYEDAREHLDIKLTKSRPGSDGNDYVTREMFDFLICYMIRFDKPGDKGFYSAFITRDMLGGWGIDEETLHRDALAAAAKEKWSIMPLLSMITLMKVREAGTAALPEIMNDPNLGQIAMTGVLMDSLDFSEQLKMLPTVIQKAREQECSPMLILNSKSGVNGAKAFVIAPVLDRVCDALDEEKLILLPSSVHEIIVLPYDMAGGSPEDLSFIVRSVNVIALAERDKLSDNAYLYEKGKGLILA